MKSAEDDHVDVAPSSMPPPRRRSPTRTQLPEEVAAYVRDLIVSGTTRPGEFLRLEPIAEAMGVSQTPVREALLALKSEGLVNLLPRRGFVVAPITPQDISDLFWAQAQLAGELAARAAEKITDEQIAQLTTNVKQYATAVKSGDWEIIPELGLEFHRDVNRAAQSSRLMLVLDAVMANLPNRYYAAGNPKQTGAEHPELLRALKEHDPERARRLMTDHISAQGSRLIDILAERGLWGDVEE
ncbi:GntR family transcriptional regulator [Kribbella caucasensis]|nr:GntR family transcriptional regulator [Kribbella sp. VKM Ac-2527]